MGFTRRTHAYDALDVLLPGWIVTRPAGTGWITAAALFALLGATPGATSRRAMQ